MAAQAPCNLSYDTMVAMIPFVMDFLDLNSELVIASGILDDYRLDDGAIAMILSHQETQSSGMVNVSDTYGQESSGTTADLPQPPGEVSASEGPNTKETEISQEPLRHSLASCMSSTVHTESFRTHFRMHEATFKALLQDLDQFTPFGEKVCTGSVSPTGMLMLTLRFLGCRQDLTQLAAATNVTEALCTSVVHESVEALYQLLPRYIQWPDDSQVIQTSEKFRQMSGLQGVLGTIDVLHVPVKAPAEHIDFYTNHQNETSVLLQSVCDDRLRFIHCCTGWPGSMDEDSVLRDSDLHNDISDQVSTYFPYDSYLVGDEAYSLTPWLMTPFAGSGNLSTLQQQFNSACRHILQDNALAYSRLMQRFPRLEYVEMKDTQSMVQMILVCCALYNFCLDNGDHEMFEDGQVIVRNINTSQPSDGSLNEEGESKRQHVLQLLQES